MVPLHCHFHRDWLKQVVMDMKHSKKKNPTPVYDAVSGSNPRHLDKSCCWREAANCAFGDSLRVECWHPDWTGCCNLLKGKERTKGPLSISQLYVLLARELDGVGRSADVWVVDARGIEPCEHLKQKENPQAQKAHMRLIRQAHRYFHSFMFKF